MPVLVTRDSSASLGVTDYSDDPGWMGPVATANPTSGICTVYVLAEAPGRTEGERRIPLIGRSGQLCRDFLAGAGIPMNEVAYGNVFSYRPPRNLVQHFGIKGKPEGYPENIAPMDAGVYCEQKWLPELNRLYYELNSLRPNVILALGNTAVWALTNQRPFISKIRGTVFKTVLCTSKAVATYHPAAALRDWTMRPIILSDISKVAYESRFPEIQRPSRTIYIPQTIQDVISFCQYAIAKAEYLAVDIETEPVPPQITSISIATQNTEAIAIPITSVPKSSQLKPGQSPHAWNSYDELTIWLHLNKLLSGPGAPVVMQNGQYDAQWLYEQCRIAVRPWHDTMLLQRSRFPEMRAGLDFLASLHTLEPAWKYLRPTAKSTKRDD